MTVAGWLANHPAKFDHGQVIAALKLLSGHNYFRVEVAMRATAD